MTSRWKLRLERRHALAHAHYLSLFAAVNGWTPPMRLAIDQLALVVPAAGSGVMS